MQQLSLPSILGTIIMCMLCLFIFTKKSDGIIKLNEIAMPVLIILIIFAFFLTSTKADIQTEMEISKIKVVLNPIIYASYNSIVLIPMLINLTNIIKTKKKAIIVSIFSVGTLITLGGIILFVVTKIENINEIEIPLLYSAGKFGSTFAFLYGMAILLAMLTSAVSACFGFLQNVSNEYKVQFKILIVLCAIAVLLSNFKFADLIEVLYPFFGYLGIMQMFFILIS